MIFPIVIFLPSFLQPTVPLVFKYEIPWYIVKEQVNIIFDICRPKDNLDSSNKFAPIQQTAMAVMMILLNIIRCMFKFNTVKWLHFIPGSWLVNI